MQDPRYSKNNASLRSTDEATLVALLKDFYPHILMHRRRKCWLSGPVRVSMMRIKSVSEDDAHQAHVDAYAESAHVRAHGCGAPLA